MSATPTLLPMGPAAVLVEGVGDPAAYAVTVRRLAALGMFDDVADVIDVVPAAATVLITFARPVDFAAVQELLGSIRIHEQLAPRGEVVEVPTSYDGPDLAAVADATGLSVSAVVDAHASGEYVVSFCGFAPGFAYLSGLPSALHLARRATPRNRVPPGSVAIAAGYSAVYPRESPGGWHLLGSTPLIMFDPARRPPSLLAPGTRVRFVPA